MKMPRMPSVAPELSIFQSVLAGLMLGAALWRGNELTVTTNGILVIAAIAMIVNACKSVRDDKDRA